jgi:tripeptide aminopeptidase
MPSGLVSLFLDAIRIEAQSLHERPMADFVRRHLDGSSIEIREDATAPLFNGECGNLICIPPGFDPSRPALALLAHLDTPRPTQNVHPVVTDTLIQSDGTTALGVDNRAGTAVLLHTLRQYATNGGPGNFIVVFTVGEELGLYGSKYVDLSPYNITACFVFDCSKRPGTFIQSAVGCSLYTATFIGKPSHAAVSPEKGISAIRMASEAIGRVKLGRLNPAMTANIGTIKGGTATNVVPERCTIEGEVREFDPSPIREYLAGIQKTFQSVAEEHGGSMEFTSCSDFEPFRLGADSTAMRLTTEVMKAVHLNPHPIEYLGGSDANMLNAKGVPAVNLGIGAQNPHGDDEFILLEDLFKTEEIAMEIIKRSAQLV